MSLKTQYIWRNWKFIWWDECTDHNVNHSLHYGSWVFEWIRFYKTEKWPKIFRLKEHIKRLFYSS
jgi:branched-chain amino acid aminotransferase